MPKKGDKKKVDRTATSTIECTINLHKRLHKKTFKERCPRAIREIRKFALQQMGTPDIRLTVQLNQFLWSRGIRNVPRRVRVRLSRKRNDDQNAAHKTFTLVSHVPVPSYKELKSVKVKDEQ
eukprot:TRINITY_DN231_c0_g1_i1.p1 TRINITY_DN231_c0_g1~~TRINITY_DN231_c0_g1_i1.p1  ORF type:complete len:122 (-),score=19.29 TRINITY_DN231_c0_g1_i1:101-466(-)